MLPRINALFVVTISLSMLPGCLTLYSKTEIVRSGETRKAVQFENPQAADTFRTASKKMESHCGGMCVGVPFVTLVSKNQQLSETALWNDAVAKCDTDQNGIITYEEAAVFAKTMEN